VFATIGSGCLAPSLRSRWTTAATAAGLLRPGGLSRPARDCRSRAVSVRVSSWPRCCSRRARRYMTSTKEGTARVRRMRGVGRSERLEVKERVKRRRTASVPDAQVLLLALRQGCKRGVKSMPSLLQGPHVSATLPQVRRDSDAAAVRAWRPRFDIEPLAASTLSVPHQPPKPPQPTNALENRHHVLHHRALGLPRRPPFPGCSWSPPMGHCPSRGGEGIRQTGAQDWREEGPRTLRMPCITRAQEVQLWANWRLQVLLAIMSGVFGLAGWHFCKPPIRNS
jgi:hypothetical protein